MHDKAIQTVLWPFLSRLEKLSSFDWLQQNTFRKKCNAAQVVYLWKMRVAITAIFFHSVTRDHEIIISLLLDNGLFCRDDMITKSIVK